MEQDEVVLYRAVGHNELEQIVETEVYTANRSRDPSQAPLAEGH